MNVFKMNQVAFAKVPEGRMKPPARAKCSSRRVFHIPRKPGNGAIFLVSFLTYLVGIFPSMVFALPADPTVQAGTAVIDTVSSSQKMNVYQSTDKAIIDWGSFSIDTLEHVDFQLSQGGVTLNRVTGNDPSQILGKLTSNGDLWLINPNGILFGNNAQVDVRGLMATTSNITNSDFLSENYNFNIPSNLSSSITNQGTITAAEGGLVALVAPGVQNLGVINARLGKVNLASGKTFTLDLYGDQLINLGIDSKVVDQVTGIDGEVLSSLITNSGSIFADGGVVRLDVNAAQDIVDHVINMDGVIQARSVMEKNGKIILMGGSEGDVHVSGTLDASGYNAGETGGEVHVLGDLVGLYDFGFIDVSGDSGGGTLLFGGDYQGNGSVPNASDTYIGPDTQIFADAVNYGNGGKTIFWADRRMLFHGIVKGRGGKYFGDGGFVEVSGKEELFFDGSVDTSAANGKTGTLLLDPDTITISSGSGSTTASGASTFTTIFEGTLESVATTTNIILQADNEIIVGNLADNLLNLQQGSGNTVTFKVTRNTITKNQLANITATTGKITFLDSNDEIRTQGGAIIFDAVGDLTIGSLTSNGGDIILKGRTFNLLGSINSGAGNVTIDSQSKIYLGGSALTGCGVGFALLCDMSIVQSELANINGNKLIIGGGFNNQFAFNGDIIVDGVTLTSADFANGVELNVKSHVSGSNGSVIFQGTASSFSALDAKAVNGVQINTSVATTTGALSLNGDTDSAVDSELSLDNISFASGVSLTSASSLALSATSKGMSSAGALTLVAPTSITLTGDLTATGAVSLTASSGITLNGGISTSSGTLNINANSSGLSLGSGISLSSVGALTLAAGSITSLGNLTLASTGSTINVNTSLVSAGSVTMTANSGLTLSNSTLTGSGSINLQGGSALSLASGMNITSSGGSVTLGASGGTITANGALTLNSNGSITVSNALTAAGAVTANANTGITLGGNFAANGIVNLDADLDNNGSGDFTISSGSLTTTNNALTLTANDLTLTGSINSGTGSTTINVSDGGSLGLGFSSGFGMNLTSAEQANILGTGDISLINGSITFAAGNSLGVSGTLTIGQSGGTITGQGDMALSGTNGLIINTSTLTSSAGFISLSASNGTITAPGTITLNATAGITINDNFTSAGTTIFNADTDANGTGSFTLASSKVVSTGNNSLLIKSGGLPLSGTLNSGTASTTIQTSLAGATIGLGASNCGGTCGLSLTSTELGKITAGTLIVGDNTNGNITVEGIASTDTDQFSSVTLNATASGSSITFENSDSTFQVLAVNASNGITLSSNLTTNGTTSFNSDNDANASGDFTLAASKTLSTTNNSLSITSNNMVLGAGSSITSGTAGTTLLTAQAGRTIGLGSGAGSFSVTNSELGQFTAASLTVGNSSNGTITVGGLTSISTPLTLNATRTGSAVNFATAVSSGLGSLTLNAGTGGVDFGVDVTTTGSLNVSSAGAITDTGVLTVAGTSSFTTNIANQTITLDNTANSFTGAVSLNTSGTTGNATLTSNNAFSLGASTVGGNLAVTAGGNNSLNVSGAIQAEGNATLRADDDIIFTAAGDITTTSGNIIVAADNDSDNNGSGGAVTMVEGTTFDAGAGTLALSADENITLGLLKTTSSSDAAVTLTSTSAGVLDGDTNGSLDIDAASGRLVADLVTGFGTKDNAIETRIFSVDIDNSTSGDINIFESDSIDVFKIDQAGPGDITVSFFGTVTNQDNAVISFTEILPNPNIPGDLGSPKGTISFNRRDISNQLIPGTGKSVGDFANGTTQKLFATFEPPKFPSDLKIDPTRGNDLESPALNLFSEAKSLLELGEGTAVLFEGLENLENVWEGTGVENTQIAERKRSKRQPPSRRPETTFEEEQVADNTRVEFPQKSSRKTTSGKRPERKKATYQSSVKEETRSLSPTFVRRDPETTKEEQVADISLSQSPPNTKKNTTSGIKPEREKATYQSSTGERIKPVKLSFKKRIQETFEDEQVADVFTKNQNSTRKISSGKIPDRERVSYQSSSDARKPARPLFDVSQAGPFDFTKR